MNHPKESQLRPGHVGGQIPSSQNPKPPEAQPVSSFVAEKAARATEAIGSGMESMGQMIREHSPEAGVLGDTGHTIADNLEAGGRYLEREGLDGIGNYLTNMIRRNPLPALIVGTGLGYLVACRMRR